MTDLRLTDPVFQSLITVLWDGLGSSGGFVGFVISALDRRDLYSRSRVLDEVSVRPLASAARTLGVTWWEVRASGIGQERTPTYHF